MKLHGSFIRGFSHRNLFKLKMSTTKVQVKLPKLSCDLRTLPILRTQKGLSMKNKREKNLVEAVREV